ncbi:DUF1566 domain-containing protein [Candidatus Sumerlaeota bacterium]|nr:DUF1566 domain-containing protein [Candidatus Sumerlaeota bacterium]
MTGRTIFKVWMVALCLSLCGGAWCFPGDLNENGYADEEDVIQVRNHVLGGEMLSDLDQLLADTNGDGAIDIADLVKILESVPIPGLIGLIKTGQAISYATFDDGYYADTVGLPRSYVNNGDGTVTDASTGLMWIQDPASIGLTGPYTFDDALAAADALDYAGFDDWRLPTVGELLTLVDSGRQYPNPTIDTDFFVVAAPSGNQNTRYYWTLTVVDDPGAATAVGWGVDFTGGTAGILSQTGTTVYYNIRPVRSGSSANNQRLPYPVFRPHFELVEDGTMVHDTTTDLVWLRDPLVVDDSILVDAPATSPKSRALIEQFNWADAISACENYEFRGYTNWRMPNRNELQSIVKYNSLNPVIDTDFFNIGAGTVFWTSTSNANNNLLAWVLSFYHGTIYTTGKANVLRVRPVRSRTSVLVVDPEALDFGTLLDELTLQISNGGDDALAWTLSEEPIVDWLTASSAQGDTAATGTFYGTEDETVTVTVSRANLAEDTYYTSLHLTSTDGADLYVPVTMIYEIPDPVLHVEPSSLDFGTTETYLTLDITNLSSPTLYWTAYDPNVSWMYMSDSQGEAPDKQTKTAPRMDVSGVEDGIVYLDVYRGGLTSGTYTATIIVDAGEYGYEEIPVLMEADGAQIVLEPRSLDFGTTGTDMWFYLTNPGNDPLQWTLTENIDWASVTDYQGAPMTGGTLNPGYSEWFYAHVDRVELPNAIYSDFLVFDGGPAGVVNMPIQMQVGNPLLDVTPTTFTMGDTATTFPVDISNLGILDMNWTLTQNPQGPSFNITSLGGNGETAYGANPITGVNDDTVVVEIERVDLDNAVYYGYFTIDAGSAGDVTVEFSFIVNEPVLYVDPPIINFGETTTNYGVAVNNLGGKVMPFTVIESPVEDWFDVSGPGGSTSAMGSYSEADATTLTVTVDRSALTTNGVYSGYFDIDAGDAGFETVFIEMTVMPILDVSSKTLNFGDSISTLSFTVSNAGYGTMNFIIDEFPQEPWVKAVTVDQATHYDDSTSPTAYERKPAIDTDGNGVFVAVWQAENELGTVGNILLSRSEDYGQTWSEPIVISQNGSGDVEDFHADISCSSLGEWIVVWESREDILGAGSDSDIFCASSFDDGMTWTAPSLVNNDGTTDMDNDTLPRVAVWVEGTAYCVWQTDGDPDDNGPDLDIMMARTDTLGASFDDPALITPNSFGVADDRNPDIEYDENGTCIVVYETNENFGMMAGTDFDIAYYYTNDWGTNWIGPSILNPDAMGDAYDCTQPRVATERTGGWMVVWTSTGAELAFGPDLDIFSVYSYTNGTMWSGMYPVNVDAAYDAEDDYDPYIAFNDVEFMASWTARKYDMQHNIFVATPYLLNMPSPEQPEKGDVQPAPNMFFGWNDMYCISTDIFETNLNHESSQIAGYFGESSNWIGVWAADDNGGESDIHYNTLSDFQVAWDSPHQLGVKHEQIYGLQSADVTVSVDRRLLPAGSYFMTIPVIETEFSQSENINVLVDVLNPTISVMPGMLDFGTVMPAMPLTINVSPGCDAHWSASVNSDDPWISLESAYGYAYEYYSIASVNAQQLNVIVNRSMITENTTVNTTVTIYSNDTSQTLEVPVQVTIEPELGVSPPAIDLGPTSLYMTLEIFPANGGVLDWATTTTANDQYLSIDTPCGSGTPACSGSTSGVVAIEMMAFRDPMPMGIYDTTYEVSQTNGAQSNISVPVRIAKAPVLDVFTDAGNQTVHIASDESLGALEALNVGTWGTTISWTFQEQTPQDFWYAYIDGQGGMDLGPMISGLGEAMIDIQIDRLAMQAATSDTLVVTTGVLTIMNYFGYGPQQMFIRIEIENPPVLSYYNADIFYNDVLYVDELDFLYYMDSITTRTLQLYNSGGGDLINYSITRLSGAEWLRAENESESFGPEDTEVFTINGLTPSNVDIGVPDNWQALGGCSNNTYLEIRNEDSGESQFIYINVDVCGP